MSGRKLIALTALQALMFAQTYALTGQPAQVRTPVLKHLAQASFQAAKPERLTQEQFTAAKDKMLADIGRAIERLDSPSVDTPALQARSRDMVRKSSVAFEKRLGKFIAGMGDAQLAEVLALARSEARYSRCLAQHKDPRQALAACVALDIKAAAIVAQQTVANKTKDDMLAQLRTARERITALAYDGGDYDEFFEFTWYAWHADDAVFFILFIPMFVLDCALSPLVAIYKVCHYFFID